MHESKDMISTINNDSTHMPQISQEGLSGLLKILGEFLLVLTDGIYKVRDELIENNYDSKLMQFFKEIAVNIHKYGNSFEKLKLICIELGYPSGFNFYPVEIDELIKVYNSDDKQKATNIINELYINKYNKDVINELYNTWQNSALLHKRLPIIKEAILAHNEGKYYLSIPPLLAQIEGLIADSYNHIGQMSGLNLKEYLSRILDKKENTFSFDIVVHNIYAHFILVSFAHGNPINSSLSRHAIMHGGDVEYGTITNSLKCILLFDYIQAKINNFL